jgi:hypothetical protein
VFVTKHCKRYLISPSTVASCRYDAIVGQRRMVFHIKDCPMKDQHMQMIEHDRELVPRQT